MAVIWVFSRGYARPTQERVLVVPSGEMYASSILLIDTVKLLHLSRLALRCSIMWRNRSISVRMQAMCISECLQSRCNSWAVWITIHATFRMVTPGPDLLPLLYCKVYVKAAMSVVQPTMSNASENQIDHIFRKSTECLPSCFAMIIESEKKC